MLQKFKSIEEIGRFFKLTHKAEPFTKLSLVFGRNGYGKSTLCSILRSAADGKADHITARRRLGAVNESRVESVWASGVTIAYSAGKWNGCPGKIHIFDQEYVFNHLHVGDSVLRENKRRLLPVVLGDHGVALAGRVVSLDKEQREVDEKRKEQSRIILARCKNLTASDLAAFCGTDVPADLHDKITAAAQRVELVKQATVVRLKRNPPLLPLGGLTNAGGLLSESIDGVSESASQLVIDHMETHKLGERGYAWLEYGTSHAPENHCPYCAQHTTDVPLVVAYRAYFSSASKALKGRIDDLWHVLDALSAEKLEDLVAANDAEFSYWANLCEITVAPTLSPADRASIADALWKLKALVGAKRQNPLEAVSLGSDQSCIIDAVAMLTEYNERITANAAVIEKARAETADGDLPKAELVHAKWLALEEKSKEPVKSAAATYEAADRRLEEIKGEKASAQVSLTTYTVTTMASRQAAVNDLLFTFGANFQIVDSKTNFVGREPSTEFAVEIGTHKVKAGDRSDTEPSFKTVLSAGDKTTLALAFFIAQIEADADLKDAIIVFDDPFNSQDMDRQFQTTSHIRSICAKACQTIVLSHDPRFLQLIEKHADNAVTRSFQLQCSDAGEGSLHGWSSADELQSLYVQQAELIREYATHVRILKGHSINAVKQAIRPFLEDHLRLRFPGRFADQSHIFDMATTIRGAGPADPLATLVQDLFALNEYTRPNMHGGAILPEPGELRVHCRKVVNILGGY